MSTKVSCGYCPVEHPANRPDHIRRCNTCEIWCCKKCARDMHFKRCPKCMNYELR